MCSCKLNHFLGVDVCHQVWTLCKVLGKWNCFGNDVVAEQPSHPCLVAHNAVSSHYVSFLLLGLILYCCVVRDHEQNENGLKNTKTQFVLVAMKKKMMKIVFTWENVCPLSTIHCHGKSNNSTKSEYTKYDSLSTTLMITSGHFPTHQRTWKTSYCLMLVSLINFHFI